jgi:uncharacterized protein
LRAFAVLLALVTWGAVAFAQEAPIPAPPTTRVTDGAGLLSAAARDALDKRLTAYERRTGHQVVVWIGSTLGSTPLEDFTVKTFKAWGLGRKGKDDGVLVAVLAKDRRIGIEVGYGLEGQVPDAVASRIINDVMVPKLRGGQPDAALTSGVDAILQAIEGKPFIEDDGGPTGSPTAAPTIPGTLKIILFVLLGAGFLLLLVTNPSLALTLLFVMAGRGGRGGGGGGFGGGGFGGGGGRSGGGGARGSW